MTTNSGCQDQQLRRAQISLLRAQLNMVQSPVSGYFDTLIHRRCVAQERTSRAEEALGLGLRASQRGEAAPGLDRHQGVLSLETFFFAPARSAKKASSAFLSLASLASPRSSWSSESVAMARAP